jgi:Tfp pilus assembly protein PilF
MGETYLAQGLFSQAREPYEKAIELDDRYYPGLHRIRQGKPLLR